ncbi:histone H1 [Panicum miliaceum]|uniref:Histone H1 n=1 Tax=Panicum miliaceum TaxID=4540 RepID=A0A3L6TFN2_PANMI|nr:histone H1 [Panicum miliaceum]
MATEVAEAPVPLAEAAPDAAAEAPAAAAVDAKPAKAKKAAASRKRANPTHPPYAEMISDAVTSLKERTGSSQYAIAKFLEDKHKDKLPPNFRKLLLVQLKKLVAAGKLTKPAFWQQTRSEVDEVRAPAAGGREPVAPGEVTTA